MMVPSAFAGLELLATAVIVLDHALVVEYANPAAENLFEFSQRSVAGQTVQKIFENPGVFVAGIEYAIENNCTYMEHDLHIGTPGHARQHLNCTITPIEVPGWHGEWSRMLAEFRPIDQQLKIARDERILDQTEANRLLLRSLAHEIKNPLGGIRGAAQLLDRELVRPDLSEYTQVIMQEADRLQSLMERLLTPNRAPQLVLVNIHEVLERVRSLMLAEFPEIVIARDYDVSLPPLKGDREQLIQATLNVVRNAAQALGGRGCIELRTRLARQVTLARKRYRHALLIEVLDDGPGVPPAISEKIFYPLVSARDGGSGLGLTIAQTFVGQHGGVIQFESVPGNTRFAILLPLREAV
ncbi:MAG TPA: nitrogen regulation protein NR(II) [Burkholderiales bacterium]|nr:nitrogen regulation protein NR(II) [Burkholderiales bacterium]